MIQAKSGVSEQKALWRLFEGEVRPRSRVRRWLGFALEIVGVTAVFLIPTLWVFGVPFIILAKLFGGD